MYKSAAAWCRALCAKQHHCVGQGPSSTSLAVLLPAAWVAYLAHKVYFLPLSLRQARLMKGTPWSASSTTGFHAVFLSQHVPALGAKQGQRLGRINYFRCKNCTLQLYIYVTQGLAGEYPFGDLQGPVSHEMASTCPQDNFLMKCSTLFIAELTTKVQMPHVLLSSCN